MLSLPLLATSVSSLLVNVTVDDTFGDPTTGAVPQYLPNDPPGTLGGWHAGNASETDDWSTSHWTPGVLDLFEIHNQTWHDSTPQNGPAQVIITFTGSAVYVYNVIPNQLFETTTTANMTFTIDGAILGNYTHTAGQSGDILYNQLVFSNTELEHSQHTLIISSEGENHSFILFDYVIYTTESSDSTSSSSPSSSATRADSGSTTVVTTTVLPSSKVPLGAVLGGVFGGLALLIGAILTTYLILRRRFQRNAPATRPLLGQTYAGAGSMNRSDPHSSTTALAVTPTDALMTQTTSSPVTPSGSPLSPPPEPSKRHAAISRRIQTLQREMSMLSASSPTVRSEVNSEGTDTVFRALETEVAALRRELAGFSSRLHEDRRTTEAPPGYLE